MKYLFKEKEGKKQHLFGSSKIYVSKMSRNMYDIYDYYQSSSSDDETDTDVLGSFESKYKKTC